eukprot:722594-Hanusia_phi.AAC.2
MVKEGKAMLGTIGLLLRNSAGNYFVAGVVSGGAAEKSGKIRDQDQLVAVNGRRVQGLPHDTVAG